jgi:hypothetical protein
VFLDLRTVVQRHIPAAEIDHSGAEPAVRVIQDSFLRHAHPLRKIAATKKGEPI